jgi:hypothetical protein
VQRRCEILDARVFFLPSAAPGPRPLPRPWHCAPAHLRPAPARLAFCELLHACGRAPRSWCLARWLAGASWLVAAWTPACERPASALSAPAARPGPRVWPSRWQRPPATRARRAHTSSLGLNPRLYLISELISTGS